MRNRKRNNIVIGTLCSVLVLMGVGYAILNTTLNIGGTANIKGDFDIHFTNIQRSSSTISDSTLLSTMDNGTGITENTSNHEGTFTAVLQKPTDYVIYDVVVANTGSIDGYLTFTFGDEHNNFNYYKDFYSVEFIRDDVTPNIKADILQNGTFTDSEVLVNTTGTRTYKIKVTFKESATSFPDATTNGAFGCSLNLTYSQQAQAQNNNQQEDPIVAQESLTWYKGEDGHQTFIMAIDENKYLKVLRNSSYDSVKTHSDIINSQQQFVPYTSSIQYEKGISGLEPQDGDYVWIMDSALQALLRNGVMYVSIEDFSDYITMIEIESPEPAWYVSNDDTFALAFDDDNFLIHYAINGYDNISDVQSQFGQIQLTPYISGTTTIQYNPFGNDNPVNGDYVWVVNNGGTLVLAAWLHENTLLLLNPTNNTTSQLEFAPNGYLEKYIYH